MRSVVFEDRSGNPVNRSAVQNAAALWNQAGVIAVSYREGPADNRCGRAVTGVVRFCLHKTMKGVGAWFIFDSRNNTPGHYAGGEVDVRPDLVGWFGPIHEGGHALGLNHSSLSSVMNVSGNGLGTQVPTEHDFDALRSIYAHADG